MSEMENQTLTSLNFSEIGDRPHVTIREPITERTTRLSDLYITQEGADLSGGDDDEGNLTDSVAIGQLIEHCSHLTDRVEQLETELSEFQESSINREQVLRGYIEGRFADMENRRQEALDEMDLEVVKCLKRRDVLWGEELKKLFKKTSTPRLPLSLPSLSSRKRSAPQQLSFDGIPLGGSESHFLDRPGRPPAHVTAIPGGSSPVPRRSGGTHGHIYNFAAYALASWRPQPAITLPSFFSRSEHLSAPSEAGQVLYPPSWAPRSGGVGGFSSFVSPIRTRDNSIPNSPRHPAASQSCLRMLPE
ncbi:UNVERIFIED_CONTAM: hypothetical protein FKN15_028097 [Acipenser sinensis]